MVVWLERKTVRISQSGKTCDDQRHHLKAVTERCFKKSGLAKHLPHNTAAALGGSSGCRFVHLHHSSVFIHLQRKGRSLAGLLGAGNDDISLPVYLRFVPGFLLSILQVCLCYYFTRQALVKIRC